MIEKLGITPGPWEVGEADLKLMVYCDDATGQRIADCTNEYTYHSQEMKEANALLIAAAPEMFEALITTMEQMEDQPGGWGFILDTCREAIFKATGKSWEEIKELL